MKRKSLGRLLSAITVMGILAGSVSGCGMAAKNEMTSAAPAATPAAEAIAEEPMVEAAPAYEYEYTEPAAADEYDVYDGYETAAAEAATDEESLGISNAYTEHSKIATGAQGEIYLGRIYDYDRYEEYENSEEYSELDEQGYKSVIKAPLSTFAADVDTASYSNLRRLLNEGYSVYDLPDGSARIEEMINYFDYDYSDPKGSEPFGVNKMISACPWNDDALLLSLGLKTEDIDFDETPDSNLVFLIDVSGSMAAPDKMPLLQEAFSMLTDELSDKDRVSIVTYANGVNTLLDGVKGDRSAKIKKEINSLFASGGTNGGKGIQTAYRLAEKNFIKGGNNRVILATDGDLNIGLTSVDELEDLISEKKESGVFLSVIGFGTGNIKDNRMETLADKGNGNYSYIDSVKEAKKVLVKELSANMLTVCKDVKLQVEFNPEMIKGYRLVGYANRTMKAKDFNDDRKDGGEIGAGHEVTVLYELIPNDEYAFRVNDDEDVDIDSLRYADEFRKNGYKAEKTKYAAGDDDELLTLSVRYKRPDEDKSSLLTYPVLASDYTDDPSDDFIFQSAVAEFGLIASVSEYKGNANIDSIIRRLARMNLNDEYKREFFELVSMQR